MIQTENTHESRCVCTFCKHLIMSEDLGWWCNQKQEVVRGYDTYDTVVTNCPSTLCQPAPDCGDEYILIKTPYEHYYIRSRDDIPIQNPPERQFVYTDFFRENKNFLEVTDVDVEVTEDDSNQK